MARYVDADLIKERLEKTIINSGTDFINSVLIGLLERAPTENVRPVVRGEWKINCDGYYPYCSNCRTEPKNGVMSNFCPHCGADMRCKK
jgi:hypothetical protein